MKSIQSVCGLMLALVLATSALAADQIGPTAENREVDDARLLPAMTFLLTLSNGTELRVVTEPGAVIRLESEELGLDLELEPRLEGPSGVSMNVFRIQHPEDESGSGQRILMETSSLWREAPSFVGPVSSLVRVELEALRSGAATSKPAGVSEPDGSDSSLFAVDTLRPRDTHGCCIVCGGVMACCSTGGCSCSIYHSCGSCCSGYCC